MLLINFFLSWVFVLSQIFLFLTDAQKISLRPPGPVTALPGFGKTSTKQIAGHLPVGKDDCGALFFWLVESQSEPRTDPVILWLNGGPGSSSFLGFFFENGPYHLADNGTRLVENPWAWNRNATYVVFDQPAGTGLSFINATNCTASSDGIASDQLEAALRGLFAKYPEYSTQPLFLASESYGGHYIPELAGRVVAGNRAGRVPPLHLEGVLVGDGWVNPLVSDATYADYAYSHGLISLAQKKKADELYATCKKEILDSLPVPSRKADRTCNMIEDYIVSAAGGVDVYDVRSYDEVDFSVIATYLDQPEVRDALNVDLRVGGFSAGSNVVGYALEKGEQGSTADLFPPLLDDMRVLIYNGIFDMDCNFMGTDAWLDAVQWGNTSQPLMRAWSSLGRVPWRAFGTVVGHTRHLGNLTQVNVNAAGHLVPMDQPKRALLLVDLFLRNASYEAFGISSDSLSDRSTRIEQDLSTISETPAFVQWQAGIRTGRSQRRGKGRRESLSRH